MAFALGPMLTMGAVEALDAHGTDELKALYLREARLRRVDGHDEPHRAAGRLRSRRACAPAPSRPATARYRIFGQKIFITYGDHDLTETSSIWCWRGCRTRRRARAASRCSWCRNSWSTPTAGSARATTSSAPARAQARHPCLADLHHGLRRRLPAERARRLAGRRGEPRPRLHVHDDEQRAARGRRPGRRRWPSAPPSRRSPMRASAGRAARRAARGAGMSADRRIIPMSRRMLLTMQALTQAARAICLCLRRTRSTGARAAAATRRATGSERAIAADAGRQGLRHRRRRRGRLARRAGAWRHGLSSRRPAPRSIYRDARIAPIYEGTNGIQAIDLVDPQAAARRGPASCALYLDDLAARRPGAQRTIGPAWAALRQSLSRAINHLARTTAFLHDSMKAGRGAGGPRRRLRLSQAVRPDPGGPLPGRGRACRSVGQPDAARALLRRSSHRRERGAGRAYPQRQRQPCRGRRATHGLSFAGERVTRTYRRRAARRGAAAAAQPAGQEERHQPQHVPGDDGGIARRRCRSGDPGPCPARRGGGVFSGQRPGRLPGCRRGQCGGCRRCLCLSRSALRRGETDRLGRRRPGDRHRRDHSPALRSHLRHSGEHLPGAVRRPRAGAGGRLQPAAAGAARQPARLCHAGAGRSAFGGSRQGGRTDLGHGSAGEAGKVGIRRRRALGGEAAQGAGASPWAAARAARTRPRTDPGRGSAVWRRRFKARRRAPRFLRSSAARRRAEPAVLRVAISRRQAQPKGVAGAAGGKYQPL